MRGNGRIEELGPGSFRWVCLCAGEARELARVTDAAEGFWSYHLRAAWGGDHQHCSVCGSVYALAGLARGWGLPDVVDLSRVDAERTSRMSPLQVRLLCVALERDSALWETMSRDVRLARHLERLEREDPAALARSTEALEAYFTPDLKSAREWSDHAPEILLGAARIVRQWLQVAKLDDLRVIAWEHGVKEFSETVRIFRTADGGGVIDWGEGKAPPLRVRAETVTLEQVMAWTEEAREATPYKVPQSLRASALPRECPAEEVLSAPREDRSEARHCPPGP